MKDKVTTFKVNDKEYKIVFNLNVMEEIQEEYGTIERWGELTDGKKSEVNIKALIFGIKEMLNEAIDIDNENRDLKVPFLTAKQVGRIITEMGIENATAKAQEAVINSTDDNTPKNA